MPAPNHKFLRIEPPSAPVGFLAVWLVAYIVVGVGSQEGERTVALVPDLMYMPFRMTLAYMLWLASRRSSDAYVARTWLLLALGQVFAVFGNSTWIVSDLTGADVSDLTYLAWTIPQSVFTVAGFVRMIREREGRSVRQGDWLDAAIVVVASITIAWYFIAARLVTTAYTDTPAVLLFFLDSASNVTTLLLAMMAWLRTPRGVSSGALLRIAISIFMVAAADLIIEAQLLYETYRAGSALDAWYATAILLYVVGADMQCMHVPVTQQPRVQPRERSDSIVLGAITACLAPLLVETASAGLLSSPAAASGIGVVVLMLLVLWRQRLARTEIGLLVATRLQLEHQLWQAQKLDAVGRLAGGIAHDFNNVLSAISSHAQLLATNPDREIVDQANDIQYATERASTLVRRLLTFSRADTTDRTAVVLGDAVKSMEQMLRQITTSGIALSLEITDDRAVVTLADGQLEQVLLNLALNSRDATPAGGSIIVSTRRVAVPPRGPLRRRGVTPGLWAVLEVRDTGAGMDRATQENMFQPFYTTKSARGGTGLGLATVAGIVQAADGHVLVDSRHGVGTTVTVFLPIALTALTSRPDGGAIAQAKSAELILVVDDELPIRSALARYLSRVGYRVIEAADAEQAISQLEQHQWAVDIVITDISMPGVTGVELAARIRTRVPRLPVLFMTGFASAAAKGNPPPRHDTIDKPFDLAAVAERVRSTLADAGRDRT